MVLDSCELVVIKKGIRSYLVPQSSVLFIGLFTSIYISLPFNTLPSFIT